MREASKRLISHAPRAPRVMSVSSHRTTYAAWGKRRRRSAVFGRSDSLKNATRSGNWEAVATSSRSLGFWNSTRWMSSSSKKRRFPAMAAVSLRSVMPRRRPTYSSPVFRKMASPAAARLQRARARPGESEAEGKSSHPARPFLLKTSFRRVQAAILAAWARYSS